ncbi:hypothetical protein GALMADRAFT_244920 [Galerina marginata CBS 339.88]|uniref:Nephrocystin 3-like N-terminal domain-containing protein n=1 Tax=Galerina marginata (strain CBS 339.88) TaxID=685588 RepID=A0A067T6L3_GALM3|nr:hypothetical protein GALMADRAFT_244920 [Galerina marginata CBS 339.88]
MHQGLTKVHVVIIPTLYSDFISHLTASWTWQHLFLLLSTTPRHPSLTELTSFPMSMPAPDPRAVVSSNGNMLIAGGTFSNVVINNPPNNNVLRTMKESFEPHVALDATHDTNRADNPRCYPGTRAAVLQALEDWARSAEGSNLSPILWLFGPAQVGKSAIAGSFAAAQAKEGRLAASFFFPRGLRTTTNGNEGEDLERKLVPTVAFQLPFSIPELQPYIARAVENNPFIFHQSAETQVEQLVVAPVLFLARTSHAFRVPRTIVIDGLDKCCDEAAQKRILAIIADTAPRLAGRIKFLIVSRPEHHITTAFNLSALKSITHPMDLMDDVTGFEEIKAAHAEHEITADPLVKELQLELKYRGSFGCARVALDLSRSGRAINKVPIFFL